ncbi:MAG: methionyl-tRNA formyltransferase [Betaproteobacteria bacterium]
MVDAFRLGFAGTPAFAAAALDAIVEAGFDVASVLTRPDAAKGRGLQVAFSPVKARAQALSLPISQPPRLRDAATASALREIALDVLVVAAYGQIVPPELLGWPRHGCINIHASLLPRWRGAAPVVRAILAGDERSGITIMRMDEGLDTGPIIAMRPHLIAKHDTAATLHDALADLGASMIVETLRTLRRDGRLDTTPQSPDGATYAQKVMRAEATIDWRDSATSIERRIRAFDPFPGAQTTLHGAVMKLWSADVVSGRFDEPGRIVQAGADGIVVACGEDALRVRELQQAGAKRLSVSAFVAGHAIPSGTLLGA